MITDGGDRNSELSDEEALRTISGTKTIVDAIVLGDAHARFLDAPRPTPAARVVAASNASRRARRCARILADINSRYLVVYQSSGTKRGWRTIDVQPRGAASRSSQRAQGVLRANESVSC